MASRVMQGALVGRDLELSEIAGLLVRAGEGAGSLVLISGEAGIGKTRLCAEAAQSHRQGGGIVLLGRAVPEEASLPRAALADSLRAARRAVPAVWDRIRNRAAVLSAIMPELASEAGVSELPVDQLVLFEALLDTVAEAAGTAATLWVLDDVHWADDATWEFVRYAARRVADLGMVLAVTYREEEIGPWHPWWPGLTRLKREPAAVSLRLARLSAADSGRLIRGLLPDSPGELLDEILERAAGTPLLIGELASLTAKPGHIPPIPYMVRATVAERAGRLTAPARTLLDFAAVVGQEVGITLLSWIAPDVEPDALVAAGLLERDEDVFRFRHPLFREAVYDRMPEELRSSLHERAADAMVKNEGTSPERVAAHLELAGRLHEALAVLENAAADASQTGHAGRKATLLLGAFQLSKRHRMLSHRRADLEQAAIENLYRAGRWSELDPLIRGAWSLRYELSQADRARLAVVFCPHLFWMGFVRHALMIANQELAALHEDLAGPLLREAAVIAWLTGDAQAARIFAGRAIEVARRVRDVELEIRAGRTEILVTYGERGDSQAAAARLREYATLAREHGLAMLAATNEAMFRLLVGDHRQCAAIISEIHQGYRLGGLVVTALIDAKEACLHLHRGDLDTARKLLAGPNSVSEAASCGLIGAEWSTARGWLAWEQGFFEEASEHLATAGADGVMRTYGPISPGPMFLPVRVDSLLRLGRLDEASAAIATAENFHLSHDRFIAAAIAAAQFRREPATERARIAETAAAAAPWPWLQALVRCWRGEFLRDLPAAEHAREQFEQVGALLGSQRATAVLRGLGVRSLDSERWAGALSPRQLEIAELVAEGLSNPVIAQRLHLSRFTVGSHVAHILDKLGFASRSQIAAWVAEHQTTSR